MGLIHQSDIGILLQIDSLGQLKNITNPYYCGIVQQQKWPCNYQLFYTQRPLKCLIANECG